MKNTFLHTAQVAAFILLGSVFAPQAHAQLSYYALPPCRVVDTRLPDAVDGGPKLGDNSKRNFQIRGGLCGVPVTAKAVWINVTVWKATSSSWITMWPSNTTMPLASTINFDQYEWSRANGAIMALGTDTLDLSVYNANGTVDLMIDVYGYYQ